MLELWDTPGYLWCTPYMPITAENLHHQQQQQQQQLVRLWFTFHRRFDKRWLHEACTDVASALDNHSQPRTATHLHAPPRPRRMRLLRPVASPAIGHWGMCPRDFQQFHF